MRLPTGALAASAAQIGSRSTSRSELLQKLAACCTSVGVARRRSTGARESPSVRPPSAAKASVGGRNGRPVIVAGASRHARSIRPEASRAATRIAILAGRAPPLDRPRQRPLEAGRPEPRTRTRTRTLAPPGPRLEGATANPNPSILFCFRGWMARSTRYALAWSPPIRHRYSCPP